MILGCSKDEPKVPSSATLIFPLENSECTIGQNVNQTTRIVTFEWEASNNTDSYKLNVKNLETDISQIISTNETFVDLPIEKGTPFSWSITSENSSVEEVANSPVWQFYNAGSQRTYAPFPTEIIAPKSGGTVFKDGNNNILLEWAGADVDSDIVEYEIYLSTENPPQSLVTTTPENIEEYRAGVASGVIYYWSVVALDNEGNTSNSGVYSFKVN